MAVLADGKGLSGMSHLVSQGVWLLIVIWGVAPGSCFLVAAERLHAVPWGGPFPQHYLVVGPRCAAGLPSLRWDTVGVSGGGTSSIGGRLTPTSFWAPTAVVNAPC